MAISRVNIDIQNERDRASFNSEGLTYIIHGEFATRRRRYIENLVEKDPDFDGPCLYYLSRDEIYEEGIRRQSLFIRKIAEYGLDTEEEKLWMSNAIFGNNSNPMSLHSSMFLPTLVSQASEEQLQRWLPAARKFEIMGTYAQTELGHGTFLRGLETTATYDGKTDEFVLNSPTQTSYKWWPGGLGKTSNYAVVMALMFINGINHGPHPFMVQLRDLRTHEPLPGITCGDIAPKFGFNMIDNGFLRLDHIRVPRDNLLMKNVMVLRDGTYIKAKHDKLAYGGMVFVRATMIERAVYKLLAQAVTIAVRYSCVRRQSQLKPGQPEVKVLDFVTQQMRLLPQISLAYAIKFAGRQMHEMYQTITQDISGGNVDSLPELHGLSSGLKALTSDEMRVAIEECRLCCGGHGYAQYSGLPQIYVQAVAACTYEGENYVMYLQCARYLMKCVDMINKGSPLPPTVSYLSREFPLCLIDQGVQLEPLLNAFKHRAKRLVSKAAQNLTRLRSQGLDQHEAWNQAHPYLVKAAKVHVQQYMLQAFADKISPISDPKIAAVLKNLILLYGAKDIIDNSGDFFEDGFLAPKQFQYVQEKFSALLKEIRPDAVALVDAFDFSDRSLGSEIGSYDGNAYERIVEFAKKSPLNKHEVHPAIRKYLLPRGTASKL